MAIKKIFFSYSRADGSDFALKLAQDLKRRSYNVWIDQEDIRAGTEWDLEIEKALETCDCLLFIETAKSVVSNNVLDEVYYALEQNKKVIPLVLVDSKTPYRLQRIQHINFTKNYDVGLTLLIKELESSPSSKVYITNDDHEVKANRPFFAKYAGLMLLILCLVIILTAFLMYWKSNSMITSAINTNVLTENNVIPESTEAIVTEEAANSKKEAAAVDTRNAPTVRQKGVSRKLMKSSPSVASNQVSKVESLIEAIPGTWTLTDVTPKARLMKGYLKVEAIDEKKVSIKGHLQFYYYQTHETSFLVVFNGFVGCSSCMLEKDMKLTNEDIAIGSRSLTIVKDETGKTDTTRDSGANKSINATVSLHFVDNKTAVIKVQQPITITLAESLILKPFVYSFRLEKSN